MLPYSRLIRGLQNRKIRQREDLFVIEGIKLLEEALFCQLDLQVVYVESDRVDEYALLLKSLEDVAPVYKISQREFSELKTTVNSQGILALAKMPRYDTYDITVSPFFLVLDGIQDPGNLGTLFRTALASGCGSVILLRNCVDPFNPKVVRSAMGALFRIPFLRDVTVQGLKEIAEESSAGLWAAILDQDATAYYQKTPELRTGLIIGNEGSGISAEVLRLGPRKVHIPIDSRAESLNAAMAAGVLLFYLRRSLII